MNKIATFLSILALVVAVVSISLSYKRTNLVFVDINKLIENYERTAVERKVFNAKVKRMQSNADSLMTAFQQELKKFEQDRAAMSSKELALTRELLQTKQQQLNNYQQGVQKQIQEEDQKMTQTVVNDINDFVKEYGKKHGYSIIFGASGSGSIMYAEEAADLTDQILEELNAQYEGI